MAPAPRFLGTQPPCETRALICHKINIGVSVRQTGRQPGGYLSKWTQLGMILSDETCDVRESKSRYQAFPIEWDVRSPCKSSKQCHWHKNWKQWNLHYWESPHMQNPTKIGCIPGTWVFEHYFQELPLSSFLDTVRVTKQSLVQIYGDINLCLLCICPGPKNPKSPSFLALLQSLSVVASSWRVALPDKISFW